MEWYEIVLLVFSSLCLWLSGLFLGISIGLSRGKSGE